MQQDEKVHDPNSQKKPQNSKIHNWPFQHFVKQNQADGKIRKNSVDLSERSQSREKMVIPIFIAV